jgi:hypothetical protein
MMTESNYQPDYSLDTIDELGLENINHPNGQQNPPENLFSTVDDETMVSRFARGKKRQIRNHNLIITYAHNSLQLSTPEGELVAINKISDKLHYILIKQDSVYWEFIHNIVLSHNFVPIDNNPSQRGFFRYQKYQIPQGYQLKYTSNQQLFDCWQENYLHIEHDLKLDLLFLNKSKWYRVQEISTQDDQLLLRSVAGTVQLPIGSQVAWIYRLLESTEVNMKERQRPKVSPPVVKAGDNELIDKLISKLGVEQDGNKKSGVFGDIKMDSEALALFEQVFDGRFLPQLSEELHQQLLDLQILAMNILEYYLENGETITRTEIINDNSGNKISEKTITTNRGCPRWVIEAIMHGPNGDAVAEDQPALENGD